jgi:hypothetical protein
MTPKDIAEKLNGIAYREPFPADVIKAAKAGGIVIVCGASDDLMEFEGAINDEVGAYDDIEIAALIISNFSVAKNFVPFAGIDDSACHGFTAGLAIVIL